MWQWNTAGKIVYTRVALGIGDKILKQYKSTDQVHSQQEKA